VVQIAGDRAPHRLAGQRGAEVGAGERSGMIRFRLRASTSICRPQRPLVSEGQTSLAAKPSSPNCAPARPARAGRIG